MKEEKVYYQDLIVKYIFVQNRSCQISIKTCHSDLELLIFPVKTIQIGTEHFLTEKSYENLCKDLLERENKNLFRSYIKLYEDSDNFSEKINFRLYNKVYVSEHNLDTIIMNGFDDLTSK